MRRISRWATVAAVCLLLTSRSAAAGGIGDGGRLFHRHCAAGRAENTIASGTSIPALRKSVLPYQGFVKVVRSGVREKLGVPRFGHRLAEADTKLIRRYIDSRPSGAA